MKKGKESEKNGRSPLPSFEETISEVECVWKVVVPNEYSSEDIESKNSIELN